MTAIGVRGGALRSATPTGVSHPTRGAPTIGTIASARRSTSSAGPLRGRRRWQPARWPRRDSERRACWSTHSRPAARWARVRGLRSDVTGGQAVRGADVATAVDSEKRCRGGRANGAGGVGSFAPRVDQRRRGIVGGAIDLRTELGAQCRLGVAPEQFVPVPSSSRTRRFPSARINLEQSSCPSAPTVRGYPRRVARGPCRGRPGRISQEMASFSQPPRATAGRSGRSRRACPRPDVEDGRTVGGTRG